MNPFGAAQGLREWRASPDNVKDDRDIVDLVQLVSTSTFFDEEFYLSSYPDVKISGFCAAEHYIRIGAKIGRNPSSSFDTDGYLNTYLDVKNRGENPLVHYEKYGKGEGRLPCPKLITTSADHDVDVVVPVYNALEDVAACLTSLATANVNCSFQVIVVNDHSDYETSSYLRDACKNLSGKNISFELIEHTENLGYTRAVNSGLKRSSARYVVTLNSDTVVTNGWLDGMIRGINSDPRLGIVGPLSNAASWQNVPNLYGEDGKFAINKLEKSPEEMASIIKFSSRRTYPRSPFVNGFCFMIRRELISAVGFMDEVTFPTGYGEENDFCIRALDAGYTLAFIDDTYVFHAKSRSFGNERREALSKDGNFSIRRKHGEERFNSLLDWVGRTNEMDEVRSRIQATLQIKNNSVSRFSLDLVSTQKTLFILPVRGGGGGVHSIVQEVAAMRAAGGVAKVAVRATDIKDYLDLYSDIDNVFDLFLPFSDETIVFSARQFDIVVATIFTSIKLVEKVVESLPWIMPAYYAQDYEPMFFEEGSDLWKEAYDSYTALPNALVFAKTNWIGRTIEERHGIPVQKVEPSIDHSVYNLNGPRFETPSAGLRVSAMIRPKTPRRGAKPTMDLLSRLKVRFGDRISINIFGCEPTSPDFQALPHDFDHTNHGVLKRHEVAALLRSVDMFIDLSDYQAFGRTGLEAMACGALAVGPASGGGWEYACHGINALVVDTSDVESCFEQISVVLEKPEQMARMQLAALETASRYSTRRAALSEQLVFAPALCLHREKYPAPSNRGRLCIVSEPHYSPNMTWSTLARERVPHPYCRSALIPNWDISLTSFEKLPVPGSGDVAILPLVSASRASDGILDWCLQWRKRGGKLVIDVGNADPVDFAEPAMIDVANILTVSTPEVLGRLKRKFVVSESRAYVLPDYLDSRFWPKPEPRKRRSGERLHIGYFGTPGDVSSLEEIQFALKRVLEKEDINLEVIGVYQDGQCDFARRVSYPRILEQTRFFQEEFIKWLRAVAQWDIVLVPDKVDYEYKFFRSAALGGAVVGCQALAQGRFAKHAENCLLAGPDPNSWHDAIMQLVKGRALRERLATASSNAVQSHWSVDANLEEYVTLLEIALHAE